MFDCGIIEARIKERTSENSEFSTGPNHITVKGLQRHDYPHFITQSNSSDISHGGVAMRRITEREYHELAKKRGYKFLGPYTGRTIDKTWWECELGHQWEAIYSSMRQGHGCPHCTGRAPKQVADYTSLAAERNFEWAGKALPADTQTKTIWICSEGHTWEAPYNRIRRGNGCPRCSSKCKKDRRDYTELATSRGLEWCGNRIPKDTRHHTEWRCSGGHEWSTTYHSIDSGSGCPVCFIESNCGEGNSAWNPNLTDEDREQKRDYQEYKDWRKRVYQRDSFTCLACGDTSGNIHAHHIYGYAERRDLRVDVNNGATLCVDCHRRFHGMYGTVGIGALDFLDFLSQGGRVDGY